MDVNKNYTHITKTQSGRGRVLVHPNNKITN